MPVMSRTQIMRKARLNMVLNTVKTLAEVEVSKLLGLLSVNYGFKSKLSREYIRELKDSGFLDIIDGFVKLSEEYKKQINLKETKEIKEADKELKEYDRSVKTVQGTEKTN